MPRGVYSRAAAPTEGAGALTITAPSAMLQSVQNTVAGQGWWKKLNQDEQAVVVNESRELSTAMLAYGTSKLRIGEHLTKLQSVLEPHNLFGRYLKSFHLSKRTAYRYIAGFNNAKARLPESVLQAAMVRGVNLIGDSEVKPLGTYTSAVEKLPPPANATPVQVDTWLDQIEQVRKEERSSGALATMPVPTDSGVLLKECYRFVSLRYKRLPNNTRTRANWIKSLVGMILSDMGVQGQQSFAPQAVPEDYKAQRGRPVAASA